MLLLLLFEKNKDEGLLFNKKKKKVIERNISSLIDSCPCNTVIVVVETTDIVLASIR